MQLFLSALIIVAHTEILTVLNSLVEVTVNSMEEKRLLSQLRLRIRPLVSLTHKLTRVEDSESQPLEKKPPSTHIMKQVMD
jgi:hypothetical protein